MTTYTFSADTWKAFCGTPAKKINIKKINVLYLCTNDACGICFSCKADDVKGLIDKEI